MGHSEDERVAVTVVYIRQVGAKAEERAEVGEPDRSSGRYGRPVALIEIYMR